MFNDKEKQDIFAAKDRIKNILHNGFQKFIDADWSEGTSFQKWVLNNCAVSGGITASVLHDETPNDIDLYYRGPSLTNFSTGLEHLFLSKDGRWRQWIKDINPNYMAVTDTDAGGKLITANAITLWNGMQIIRLDTVEAMRRSFDFVHCLPMYDFKNLYISKPQYDSIKQKRLVIHNPSAITRYRVSKFEQRGWKRNGILI